jgi:hypothetical protein
VVALTEFCAYSEELWGSIKFSSFLIRGCSDYYLLREMKVFTASGQDAYSQTSELQELLVDLTVDSTTQVISDCQNT